MIEKREKERKVSERQRKREMRYHVNEREKHDI